MTYLAVPIVGDTLEEAIRMIALARQQGAELLELRLDLLPRGAADALPPLAELPVLATCRSVEEGGRPAEPDPADRARLLARAQSAGAQFVDFELAGWKSSPAARQILDSSVQLAPMPASALPGHRGKLVLSAHDFAGPPADPKTLLTTLWDSPAAVAKLAYHAERITDSFIALDALHHGRQLGQLTIALAMGEAGVMTRLLARKLGAFATFAALDAGMATAAGQPTLAQFKQLYRWDALNVATRLFGVIGCPVAHSMSPAIHNAAFDATGYDGLYLPLRVEPDAQIFDGLLDGLRQRSDWLHFRGLSVTIPHKENALRYVQSRGGTVEPLGLRIGAINTIRFEPDGTVSGRNTDYAAAIDAVCDRIGCERAGLSGRTVAVLGAGGAARAIVAGLVDAGASVTIYNRTLSRAEQLAAEFGCTARSLEGCCVGSAEVIINATSIGMHPHVDESPLPDGAIGADQVVFDTVYNPVHTRLLRQAESAGARTVDGVAMFVRQAVAQFEWWTQLPAPVDVMRKIVQDRLTAHL